MVIIKESPQREETRVDGSTKRWVITQETVPCFPVCFEPRVSEGLLTMTITVPLTLIWKYLSLYQQSLYKILILTKTSNYRLQYFPEANLVVLLPKLNRTFTATLSHYTTEFLLLNYGHNRKIRPKILSLPFEISTFSAVLGSSGKLLVVTPGVNVCKLVWHSHILTTILFFFKHHFTCGKWFMHRK